MNYKALIASYEVDVQFPDVSGMEHLDMLMTRSEIAQNELHLSDEERERVLKADRIFLQHAKEFYASIRRVADLSNWRRDERVPPTHWWWYLDVIVQIPAHLSKSAAPESSSNRHRNPEAKAVPRK
ncbi:MAG: hypothetical protein GVY30_06420 [Chloroflexi bacterium]|jgi:hypothetical protein|nr:hypothetical protein [Chloroflexota bacterium]